MKVALFLLAFLLYANTASAMVEFIPRDGMITGAQALAIITISDIRTIPSEPGESYDRVGKASVQQSFKGALPATFEIYGMQRAFCGGPCVLENGTYLAFLRQDGDHWTDAGSIAPLCPIKDNQVIDWSTSMEHKPQPAPLADVIKFIKDQLAKPSPTTSGK